MNRASQTAGHELSLQGEEVLGTNQPFKQELGKEQCGLWLE